ncbi:hypothetical protein JKF63_07888 [Porcisia hertigi]|uniref:Uncharacterized protein n=1 Tax=Porcisia hertigi TaxID=2761500 RepID=A0A836LJT5_9TRYP|nr:hypothetical protein JKF63_07888 [Porcisia hertigi]
MSHDRLRSSRADDALVARHPRDSATQVEPRVKVDPRTHAKSFYQREPDGSEVYACYYNSNDDPTFQERYNNQKNSRSFVQSMQCAFVSGGAGDHGPNTGYTQHRHATRPGRVRPPVVVEEAVDTDGREVHAGEGTKQTSQQRTNDPIVEEPDEGDVADSGAASRTRGVSNRRGDLRVHRDSTRSAYSPNNSAPVRDPWGIDSMMAQMMQPLSASHRSHRHELMPNNVGGIMGGPFSSPFFGSGELDSPFRMMDAMRYHMRQQRAAMFGGVDPFPQLF